MLNDHPQDNTNDLHSTASSIAPAIGNKPESDINQQQKDVPKESASLTEKIQLVIVCIAALLAMLSFVAFIISSDVRTLFGTSILAYPLLKIVDYYFSRSEILKK